MTTESDKQAGKFREQSAAFKDKFLAAKQDAHGDVWVADRMMYVVDFLDTTLQGFFAFQDVLWDRFGENGEFLAQHVGNVLDDRLRYVQQQADKAAESSQKKVDAWVEAQKSLPQEVENAIRKLPETWAKERMSETLESAMLEAIRTFADSLQQQTEQTWQHSKLGAAWMDSLQKLMAPDGESGQKLAADLQKQMGKSLSAWLKTALADESFLKKILGDAIQPAMEQAFRDAAQSGTAAGDVIGSAIQQAIHAYFLKHPVDTGNMVRAVDNLHKKQTRIEERLDQMQQHHEDLGARMDNMLGELQQMHTQWSKQAEALMQTLQVVKSALA